MCAAHEVQLVGTRLEVDPVVGPDGYTLDVNLAMRYDYTPPSTTSTADPKSNGNLIQIAMPGTEFHRAEIVTALTVSRGMTKLLGVWKPEGAVEHEGKDKDVMQAAFLKVELAPMVKPSE